MTSYRELVDPLYEIVVSSETPGAYFERIRAIPENLVLMFAAHLTYWEVGNGGFTQFFGNSSGMVAPEAVRGFRMLGMRRCAVIVERAIAHFGRPYPRDWHQRCAMLEGGNEPLGIFRHGKNVQLKALDKELFPLVDEEAGGFEAAADLYAARLTASSN